MSGTATSCVDEDQWGAWPAGFWNGATYEFFYGAAAGRKGTITTSTGVAGSQGVTLNFGDSGTVPVKGDYLILRKTVPGGAAGGWWPTTTGAGTVGTNTTDLPPGTLGKQTALLNAPNPSDSASIAGFFDSTAGKTFVQLNGTYKLQFKAKGTGGSNQIKLTASRTGVATYLSQAVTLTNSWNTYTLTFTASENGSAIGTAGVSFATVGADSFELDDVSLTKTGGDSTNTTIFRDPVVNALRTLQPGILRFWGGQLGDTLDNLLTPQFGRQRAGYSAWATDVGVINYGLHDFLALCQLVGTEPWFVVPSTFSLADASNLIEYLGGASGTTYGAKRTALGQATPWTKVFGKIHLEFGNESWNGTFKGGSIEYSAPYGSRAQAIFAAMRSNASYVPAALDLVLGGQAGWPGRNAEIQNNCNNNDSFDVAVYTMETVDTYSDNESLFGSTFAEPEALASSAGTAEGLTPGMLYQDYQAIKSSSHPVPLSFYEVNMGTVSGAISQAALDSYTPSLGAGLTVANTMLLSLKQFGVVNQDLFALPQYNFKRPDGKSALLWGAVVDMGVTDRRRPQYLALQLANQALSSGASMLQTAHSGADPTWNQPLVNSVKFSAAHSLQSYAFSQGNTRSAVVFNFSRGATLPVTFSGANAPSGTVQMQQLTSAQPTDTNEAANVVKITPTTLTAFNPSAGLSLPPYSMTVLTWTAAAAATAPAITAVSAASVTSTSAAINWTTDQAASSQVKYGTTTAYGSSSALDSALVTSHSASLSGLTPNTTYNYYVVSANSAGISNSSPNYTFTTSASLTASGPQILGVASSNVTSSAVTISWSTDVPATGTVSYGESAALGQVSPTQTALTTSHTVELTGLKVRTPYYFVVQSANASGISSTSAAATFTTTGPTGGLPPVEISGAPPQIGYLAYWGITSSSVTISWSTDVAATTAVGYGTSTALGQITPVQTNLASTHGVTLSGLKSGTTYYFVAQSVDVNGKLGVSPTYIFTTVSNSLPVISGVTVTPASNNKVQISWQTSVPANSYVQFGLTNAYNYYSSLTTLTTTPQPGISWVPSGVIHYQLVSTDANGNRSVSPDYTFTEP